MSKPIPLRLLVHNATLRHKTGQDRDRNTTYIESSLQHIRIEPTLRTVKGSTGETKADTMTMFIDRVNSTYVLPEELDVVIWDNRSFTVRSVQPCCAQEALPHHWEVTLE